MNTELTEHIEIMQGVLDGKPWLIKGRSAPEGEWETPRNADPLIYLRGGYAIKLKPAPVMVPLGPEDVPPGSAFRHKQLGGMPIHSVLCITDDGVILPAQIVGKENYFATWDALRDNAEINRSIPLTGRWDKDAWEKCEKPEVKP